MSTRPRWLAGRVLKSTDGRACEAPEAERAKVMDAQGR
jgi:hypothetical protein